MLLTGLLCHLDDACISNPCRGGSKCDTNPITGMFNCNCPSGYTGSTCNIDRDECSIGELYFTKSETHVKLQLCTRSNSVGPFFSLHQQVPTLVNMVASVSTPTAPSPVTVSRVMQDPAVNRMSMSVLPTPARMMAHVLIALATTPAFACLVYYSKN